MRRFGRPGRERGLKRRGWLMLLSLMLSTLCWWSCAHAEARLLPDGQVWMTVPDARLILGEVRGLQAENSALRVSLEDERGRYDALAGQLQQVVAGLDQERQAREALAKLQQEQVAALQGQIREERAAGWRRSVLALVLGAGIGLVCGN